MNRFLIAVLASNSNLLAELESHYHSNHYAIHQYFRISRLIAFIFLLFHSVKLFHLVFATRAPYISVPRFISSTNPIILSIGVPILV